MRETALRTFRTARHLKASQMVHRLYGSPKKALIGRWGPEYLRWLRRGKSTPRVGTLPRLRGLSTVASGRADGEDLGLALGRALEILEGRFRFLNREERWAREVDWDGPGRNFLWNYALHSFEFATDLGCLFVRRREEAAYQTFRRLVDDWVARNPCGHRPGWDPYPLSKRVAAWIYASRMFGERLWSDAEFAERFLESLSDQVLFLENNLELHLRGNHLWENLWSLALAGFYFDTADGRRWRARGLDGLWAQVREQVLPDGGHFERSPHYHCLMLKSLLEARAVFLEAGVDFPRDVLERLRRMLEFLDGVLHPDGQIPLLNDSVLGEVNPISLLRMGWVLAGAPARGEPSEPLGLPGDLWVEQRARPAPGETAPSGRPAALAFPDTGYYVFRRDAGSHLIVDAAPLGPDYQPGHGHADILSFELSVAGLRFVVDSGVSAYYAEQAWRDYERGTRGHNTVEIDGRNQSELWSQFRVGRRARPRNVKRLGARGLEGLRASHDGYDHLPGSPRHTRTWLQSDPGFWLIVDELRGMDCHRCIGRIHLHPECEVERQSDTGIRVSRGGRLLRLEWAPGVGLELKRGEEDPIQGWYAPEFGRRIPGWVVEAVVVGELPKVSAVALVPDVDGPVKVAVEENERPLPVEVGLPGGRYRFEIDGAGVRLDANRYQFINQQITTVS